MGSMAYGAEENGKDRLKSITAVVLIHAGVGYGLFTGMGVDIVRSMSDSLNVITIENPSLAEPKQKTEPADANAKAEEGAASAKNLEAMATQIVLPEPEVPLPAINPVLTAPKAGDGDDVTAGASAEPGPGSGLSGTGDGMGSGRSGAGMSGGVASLPRHLEGRITNRDFPRAARQQSARGKVITRFTITPEGEARNCRIKQSSGNDALDTATCRLIEARFRYQPARNDRGDAISHPAGWIQDWWQERGGRRIDD